VSAAPGPELDRARRTAHVALVAAPLLLTVWWYRGRPANFTGTAGADAGGALHDLIAHLYPFASFFVLACLLPVVFLRGGGVLGGGRAAPPRPLAAFGVRRPTDARAVWATLAAIPLLVLPVAWLGSRMPEVRAEYPMLRSLAEHPDWVLPYEAGYVLLYYVAWEFFFRGWLLFTVEAAYGGVLAVVVQTLASCLLHLGKPEGETFGAIPFGLVTGYVALRTRSIWPTFLVHASLGVATDLFALRAA
jgi:membrane protease YdiL (CAAX protease family)